MDKFIINLKNGVECAGPFVNKYNQNFDAIRFFIDEDKDFSSCSFAVVVSAFDDVCMISEDDEKLTRGTENEKTYLDWNIGSEVTSADGVVIYQVVAYKSGEGGNVDAIWYSPEGRIFVGDSINTTEYEMSQIGSKPGILMQILSNISLCKENTDTNRESIDTLSLAFSNHKDTIGNYENQIQKNENDIKDMDSVVSNIALRLSVGEELTQKNAQEISEHTQSITENKEDISLVNSQVNLIEQELSEVNNSVKLANENIQNFEYDITKAKNDLSDCSVRISKNESDISSCKERETSLEEQVIEVQNLAGSNESAIDVHNSDISNPHKVTASQVGLGNVDNTSDMDKPLSNATKEALDNISEKIDGLGDNLFQTKTELLDYSKETEITFPHVGYILNTKGDLTERSDMAVSDYIDLKDVGQIYKYGLSVLFSVYQYCFYDENYNLIEFFPKYKPEAFVTINGRSTSVEYPLLDGARYIRITHEICHTGFKYRIVPKTTTYRLDVAICDKYSQFLFHTQDAIVNFGDSIFGNNDSLTGVSNLIAYNMGNTVYNCAFGGTRMVTRGSNDTGYDKFDFSTLVDSIVSGDYSAQESAVASYSMSYYYQDRLNLLKSVDFNKVKIVTLNHGTNDYTASVTPTLFKEKYIEAVSKFQSAFPHINVVIITPTWRCWLNDDKSFNEDGNIRQYSSYTLPDYVNAAVEISKEMNIPFIDVYNIGINKYNWSNFFSDSDTTHQNENGRRKLAQVISRALTLIA